MNRRLPLLLGWLMSAILVLAACDNSDASTPTPVASRPTGGGPLIASPGLSVLPTATPLPRPTPAATSTPLLTTSTPLPATATLPPGGTTTISTPTTLTPAPTATLIVDGLARLVLQPNETPSGLTLDPTRSGEQSNETVADGDATRLQQLKSWARQTGYIAVYQAASPAPTGTISLLSSAAAFFATPDGASAAWADAVNRLKAGLPLTEVAAASHYGSQSALLAYTDPTSSVATVVLVIASGQLVTEITAVGTQISPASIYPLAQIVADRMK